MRFIAAVLLALYVIAILPFDVSAAGKDLIRVGLFDRQELYSVDASQKPRGYLIDYLNQINRYVSGSLFEFAFVYGSPGTLHKMLLDGSLDLTYSAEKERQESFLYSER